MNPDIFNLDFDQVKDVWVKSWLVFLGPKRSVNSSESKFTITGGQFTSSVLQQSVARADNPEVFSSAAWGMGWNALSSLRMTTGWRERLTGIPVGEGAWQKVHEVQQTLALGIEG